MGRDMKIYKAEIEIFPNKDRFYYIVEVVGEYERKKLIELTKTELKNLHESIATLLKAEE